MIRIKFQYNIYIIIWTSFIVAIILQMITCPLQLTCIPRPSWLNLLLIYWTAELPNRINIGTGFIIGLIADIILGPILGIRAMTYSLVTYYLITKFPLFYNMSCLKQTLIIILLSFKIYTIVYLITGIVLPINQIRYYPEVFLDSITNGVTWIGIFSIMKKFYTYNKIKNK